MKSSREKDHAWQQRPSMANPPVKSMQIHRALPRPSGSESSHLSTPQVTLRSRQTEEHSREAVSAHREPEIQAAVLA